MSTRCNYFGLRLLENLVPVITALIRLVFTAMLLNLVSHKYNLQGVTDRPRIPVGFFWDQVGQHL